MRWIPGVALLSLLGLSTVLADDCEGLKWNLAREYALYAGTPTRVQAATEARQAPAVHIDTLYEIALAPRAQVHYALPPGRQVPADDGFGGIVSVTVPAGADYRIGLDAPFWIDVIGDGRLLASKDFGSAHGCSQPPHKLVVFELQAGTRYRLQLNGPAGRSVRITVVRSEPATG